MVVRRMVESASTVVLAEEKNFIQQNSLAREKNFTSKGKKELPLRSCGLCPACAAYSSSSV